MYSGGSYMQEMYPTKTTADPPLQRLQQLHPQDGSPLPLAEQLCRPPQPQTLLPLHGLHGPRLWVSHDPRLWDFLGRVHWPLGRDWQATRTRVHGLQQTCSHLLCNLHDLRCICTELNNTYKNLCQFSGTFVALGGLTLWHARLIHAGQTSIEVFFTLWPIELF